MMNDIKELMESDGVKKNLASQLVIVLLLIVTTFKIRL